MKKTITTLIALLALVINVQAAVIEQGTDGYIVLNCSEVTNFTSNVDGWSPTLTDSEKAALKGATKLKVVGELPWMDGFNALNGYLNQNLTALDLSQAMFDQVGTQLPTKMKAGLRELYLPTSPDFTSIPAQFCTSAENLLTLDIPANIQNIGAMAFKAAKSLTELTLHDGLKTIGRAAFNECAVLPSVSIPGTVTDIATEAFIDCFALTKVVFQEHLGADGKSDVNMHVAEKAFRQGQQLLDVYIETTSLIDCDNNAFDFTITWGQGVTNTDLCVLHFPAGDDAILEHYTNVNHYLTNKIASNGKLFHEWLVDHYDKAQISNDPKGNGWWEFVQSGPSTPDEPRYDDNKFLRTFSDYHNARLVPYGVRAYIVNGYEENANGYYELSLERLYVIPANTGVILYGETNSRDKDGNPTLSMPVVRFDPNGPDGENEGMALSRDTWSRLSSETWDGHPVADNVRLKNYLVPTDNAAGSSTTLQPYVRNSNNEVIFRNFGMMRFGSTDTGAKYVETEGHSINNNFVGFFRCHKNSSIKAGYAYLHMAADEFANPAGSECIVLKDEQYDLELNPNSQDGSLVKIDKYWKIAKWENVDEWGERSKVPNINNYASLFMDEFEDDVDGVVKVRIPIADTDEYYTLFGVKVSNPTKSGIYIKNGKKVVIK